jgi:Reverse transcriptase (RNA-dependent DNA polymerase)
MIFLDLKKAYDTLDRDCALQILQNYGVGPNTRSIIAQTSAMDRMIPRQAGFYGEPFTTSHGVWQGDIMSPFIFNIICDAVIRHCERSMLQGGTKSIFYANDRVLIGGNPTQLQQLLDTYTDAFEWVGLQMNRTKMKAMIIAGQKSRMPMSATAYLRKTTGEGISFMECMNAKVAYPLCETEVRSQYLKTHQQTRKCLELW